MSDLPIIAVHIDSIFSGQEIDAVFINGIFQISENNTSVNTGDRYGKMEVTSISSTNITMHNMNSISLTQGSTADIMENIKFRVADSDILRFYPYIDSSEYEIYMRRGVVSTGLNNVSAWDALNFAGFWYDLNTGSYSESLKIENLSGRLIHEGDLSYTASNIRIPYSVAEKTGEIPNGTDGTYIAAGWGGDKNMAIKGKSNKLAKILVEHGASVNEKKTLVAGEIWDMGEGYTLTAQAIDAKASPRQAWLVFSRNGTKLDDKVVSQGSVYTYTEKNLAGETDVPLFVTYINSIFIGATSDMVQLRYTWLISRNVTEIKAGDRFDVLKVTKVEPDLIVLENYHSISLSPGSSIDLIGNLKLTVADSPDLRFYPSKVPASDTIIPDTLPPSVTNLSLSTYTPLINEPVNITVNVSDASLNTSGTFVSIKHPEGYTSISPMIYSGNGTYYSNFINTSEYGRYNVTIIASDLADNVNNTERTWFVTTMPPYVNQSVRTTANNVTELDDREKTNATPYVIG